MSQLPTPDPNTISEADFVDVWGAYVKRSGDLFTYEEVIGKPHNRVWTIVEAESECGEYTHHVACAGFHVVNKLGYCLTKQPWTDSDTEAYWFFDDIPRDPEDMGG